MNFKLSKYIDKNTDQAPDRNLTPFQRIGQALKDLPRYFHLYQND